MEDFTSRGKFDLERVFCPKQMVTIIIFYLTCTTIRPPESVKALLEKGDNIKMFQKKVAQPHYFITTEANTDYIAEKLAGNQNRTAQMWHKMFEYINSAEGVRT